MTYRSGGIPPSAACKGPLPNGVEASSGSSVERTRPSKVRIDDMLAPMGSDMASSSRDASEVAHGVPGEDRGDDRDDDGAVVFDEPGEAPHRQVRVQPEIPVPRAEMVRRHRASSLAQSPMVRGLRERSGKCPSAQKT